MTIFAMKHYFFSFFILLSAHIGLSQNNKQSTLKPGDKILETISNYTDNVSFKKYELPNKSFTLIYRYADKNGVKDNYDSLYTVVNHVYRLNKYFGPRKKPSRLTCVIFVKEVNDEAKALKNRIKGWNQAIGDSFVKSDRVGFNFSRPWEIIFVKDSGLKANSILTQGKVTVVSPDGVLLASSPIKAFRFGEKKGSIKGKLLTDRKGVKVPLPNIRVSLFSSNNQVPDSTLTDDYGDFELATPDDKAEYSVVVKSQPPGVTNIILATQSGQEIKELKKTKHGFEYKLIETDMILLKEMEEDDDITLKFKSFEASKKTDLKVTENILYGLGSFTIDDESKEILDKVVKILEQNATVKLEVISHTDAQGEDKANLLLSEKRSAAVIQYFVSKGINPARLKSLGKGETEIRNRCSNGVNCSDKEHEFNRRTEFKFSRS